MDKKTHFRQIRKMIPAYDPGIIQGFLDAVDRDYLKACKSDEIAKHLEISESLSFHHPVEIEIVQTDQNQYKVVVIAYDYFSEFAIICGLLSSLGLNIIGGNIQTLSKKGGRKKIIDLLEVQGVGGAEFSPENQQRFKTELRILVSLLEKDQFREARSRVDKRLISHIQQGQKPLESSLNNLKGLLAPTQIRFNNSLSEHWTILTIKGKDTPAFLYAFSNALAMRNIYIHKIKIHHQEDKIDDRLYISNRQGRKITRHNEQKALQIAAVLIKQFIHFLPGAPNPAMAITHFDQFLDKILESKDSRPFISFLKQKQTMTLLARFFGTSNFLWEDFLRLRFDTLFPILERFRKKPLLVSQATLRRNLKQKLSSAKDFQTRRHIVNEYKDQELFRIDLRHLHDALGELNRFSEALTQLAEVIVSVSLDICRSHLNEKYGTPRMSNGRPSPFTIFGLGKFGGRELGYASDIELLFVYWNNGKTSGENSIENGLYFDQLAQEIIKFIQTRQAGIFQVDARLRPYGEAGRHAIPLTQFESYYSKTGKAAPFERQALIKLRQVAGSRTLGNQCEAVRDRFVYSPEPWDKKDAMELRDQQREELVPKGQTNVKYSPGGLVEIEYLVQYAQLVYGKDLPSLQTPNTLETIAALSKENVLKKETCHCLKESYLFLRSLIDALRIVRGNAKDLLLPDTESDEFIFLARRMGFSKNNWGHGSEQLSRAISHNMSEVHQHYKDFLSQH